MQFPVRGLPCFSQSSFHAEPPRRRVEANPGLTRELAKKLASLGTELKSRLDSHETAIVEVLQRVMLLLDPPPGPEIPAKEMGFHPTLAKPSKT